MNVHFTKMHGAGNDFIVLDNFELGMKLDEFIKIASKLCHRKFGIGADGLLILDRPVDSRTDFTMIYRNADGSDAGMCGNGARCIARFASEKGMGEKLRFNVHESIYEAQIKNNNVEISFPDVPKPKVVDIEGHELIQVYPGTEHVVKHVPRSYLEQDEFLINLGKKIRYHQKLNPPGSNVNFMTVSVDDCLHLQTYERGVENLTLACGTGAIASAIAAHFSRAQHTFHKKTTVKVRGGTLKVSFNFHKKDNLYTNIKLKGPAHFVFSGEINV